MKILFINHFPLTESESGLYTINLIKKLESKNHECAVVFPENTVDYENFNDVKLYPVFFQGKEEYDLEDPIEFNIPCFDSHPRSDYKFSEMNLFRRNEYQEIFFKEIANVIYEYEPDVIHSNHLWVLSGISSSLGEMYKVPLVITCHGNDLLEIEKEKERRLNWGTMWAHEAFDYASSIITLSEEDKGKIEKEFGSSNKIKLIGDNNIEYLEEIYKEAISNNEKSE